MSDDKYPDLVERVYGQDRDSPCQHGHFDCAEYDGGPCAGETLDSLIRQRDDDLETNSFEAQRLKGGTNVHSS